MSVGFVTLVNQHENARVKLHVVCDLFDSTVFFHVTS